MTWARWALWRSTNTSSLASLLVVVRSSERTTMAVVAQVNDGAGRWLRLVASGRPLDGSVTQAAGNFSAIALRDGSAKAKVQLLPFDGDDYGVFVFVDSILLLNESQSSERLSLTIKVDGDDRSGAGEKAPCGCEARHQRGNGALPAWCDRARDRRHRRRCQRPHGPC